jgi:zinc/manganese transport system substrate-binding protein
MLFAQVLCSRRVGKRSKLLLLTLALLASGCGLANNTTAAGGGKVEVVAAENSWGSIAAQLGGEKVRVTSLITNPATDPHDYDATPRDAQAIARARYVIVNGAGYDPWAGKLASANPVPGRVLLVVGDLVGVKEGGNPHLWYSASYVAQVIDRITADLDQLDAADSGYFDHQARQYRTVGLKDYLETIGAIRQKYAGTPVGASESIFAYMAQATGLNLVTPPGYLKAISDGTDPSAADKATADEQVSHGRVRVFVFNSQNSAPEVEGLVTKARAAGIPVVEITETLSPAGLTFQDWQAGELKALLAALGG